MRNLAWFAAAIFFLPCAAAQDSSDWKSRWEAGGAIGYGLYRDGSVYAPAGKVTAGIRDRFTAGVVLTENRFEHFSGEFRYLYHDGDPFLSAGGVQTNVQGQSHTFHYDVLVHVFGRKSRVRPYAAAGAGGKFYRVSGPPAVAPPFAKIASLNAQDQWLFLVSVGGGVSVKLQRHLALRFDFRDYLTTFPKKMISPAANGTARGIFQQFTPLAGLSYVF